MQVSGKKQTGAPENLAASFIKLQFLEIPYILFIYGK